MLWAKLIDHGLCIGCHACSTACKSENEVPLSVHRTYVKSVEVGLFPQVRRAYQVTRCNQCELAPCVTACPTAAMYRRSDGIVDFDKRSCIGCKACIAACPYDAIFINPADHSAEKCNFCAHRLEVGLEPACVVVCPTRALVVGDLNDPASPVARAVNRDVVHVRRPEKETRPKVFYKGAHQATLDPLAAARPGGGLFMWSEQAEGPGRVVSGHPGTPNSVAAARLAYDVPHTVPWDWRVGLYTWLKSIAAGAYLVPVLLALAGLLAPGALVGWVAPVLAGVALAATGAVLIWDLEHPSRFYYIFTRAQGRSWLVRGAYIITGYAALLGLHVVATLTNANLMVPLAVLGVPLAAMTAVYTAYLFAQAKARDLWQSPLLAPHLFVQACLAGAAATMLAGGATGLLTADARVSLAWTLAGAAAVHLLLVVSEATIVHPTAHARLAAWELVSGRHRTAFWSGVLLLLPALAAPWLGAVAAVAALGGLLAHEHAYVQAGQSVPLA
jgi:Fe-S-cluster-containing dehydrogenase component/formate-dependent nitrite reductase membrane component NrfD